MEGIRLDRIFTDKASGKDTKRPQLEAMMEFVREGDVVVVHSMDRLARNLDDLRRVVTALTKRGIKVEFVKESLTFTGEDSPTATLLLNVMGSFAQFERELIKERQREASPSPRRKAFTKAANRLCPESKLPNFVSGLLRGRRKQGSPVTLTSAAKPFTSICVHS